MFDWLNKALLGRFIGSIIRHLLPFISTYLVGINLDPELVARFTSDLSVVLTAVGSLLFSLAWSFIQKKKG